MKGVTNQSGFIKIIGPSFSFYNPTSYNKFLGGSSDITGSSAYGYYIDYIDFHTYPFQNENYWKTGTADSSGSTPVTRPDVIKNINAAGKLKDDLAEIITRIQDSTSRNTSNLKITITEANISYQQDRNNKLVTDLGPGSFLGGQYWAEMMGVSMEKGVALLCFWSVIEGTASGGSNYKSDIGYISSEDSTERPNYWHYKMMADNFRGTFKPNLYVGNDTTYKAFGYKNTAANEVGVIILNQDIQTTPSRGTDYSTKSFKINFNNGTPSGIYDMKFSFNDSVSAIIDFPCTIMKETTMLLVFDITTGALKKKETYSLQDALRTNDTGTLTVITDSTEYYNYTSATVHSNITIGTGSSITAGANKTFKATNSIRLNGPFSSGTKTLSLLIDQTCP